MKNRALYQRLLLVPIVLLLVIIIGFIVMTGNRKTETPKVGLIITGKITDRGWNGMHYQGALYACEKLGAELLVKENIPEESENCAKAVHKLAKEGASMIILSSYGYPAKISDVIQCYPEIAFYGSSAEYYADNLTSYLGRMYQPRYLTGIIAGLQTKSNSIGYVAAMPNMEVIRGINAFTLGVKSVNPDAVVNVIWTDSWENEEKETTAVNIIIKETEADVIAYHQNQHYVAKKADEVGVYSIGYNDKTEGLSDKYLTAAIWDFQALYYQIVREFVLGKANTVKRHWFGMNTGVVKLSDLSPLVSEKARQKVEEARQDILSGKDVFSGIIYDNNGVLRCNKEESVSDEQLLEKMDWFVDGVVIYEKEAGHQKN